MKAIKILLLFLLVNIMASVVINANIFTGTTYYESEFRNMTEQLPNNISATTEEGERFNALNIFNILLSGISFNWLYAFVPPYLKSEFAMFINGLNAFGVLIGAIALLEIWMKRSDIV